MIDRDRTKCDVDSRAGRATGLFTAGRPIIVCKYDQSIGPKVSDKQP